MTITHPLTDQVIEAKRRSLIKEYYYKANPTNTQTMTKLYIEFHDHTPYITKTKLRHHIEQTYLTPTALIEDETILRIDLEARL